MVVPGGGKWKNKDLGAFEKMHDAAIAKPASVVDPEVMQLAWDELVDDKQEISMNALLELMDGDKPDPKQVYSAFVAFTSSDYGTCSLVLLRARLSRSSHLLVLFAPASPAPLTYHPAHRTSVLHHAQEGEEQGHAFQGQGAEASQDGYGGVLLEPRRRRHLHGRLLGVLCMRHLHMCIFWPRRPVFLSCRAAGVG